MPSHTISFKVPDELKEAVEDYQDEGESQSAAVRRLVRRGLDAEDDSSNGANAQIDSILERIASGRLLVPSFVSGAFGTILPFAGIVAVQQGEVLIGTVAFVVAVVLMVVGLVGAASVVLAQLALAKPLRGLVGLGVGGGIDE